MQTDYLDKFWTIIQNETAGITRQDIMVLLAVEIMALLALGIAFRRKGKVTARKILYVLAVLADIYVLFLLTVFRREPGSREGIVHLNINLGFGLRTGHPSWTMAFSLLNIFLFVPFGYLIYLLFRKQNRFLGVLVTVFIGLLMSLAVECSQFLTGRGMFEVTDLVTNTIGAFVGAVIADLLYNTIFMNLRKRQ